MINLKNLLLENYHGKTFISVDIQPEYHPDHSFSMESFTTFINENYEDFHNLVFLYNGEDLGMISEDEYKEWLISNGLDESVLYRAKFYDKGYAFFRYCMDKSIDEDAIANFVRFMYENNINDSREMNREMWAKYLREYRRLDRKEVYELLQCSADCVHIPDLMKYIKQFNNVILTGGAINECLKEVEIAFKALKISYEIDSTWTY